jgi:hypothetical protein
MAAAKRKNVGGIMEKITVFDGENRQCIIGPERELPRVQFWLGLTGVRLGRGQPIDESGATLLSDYVGDLAWVETPIDNLFKQLDVPVHKVNTVADYPQSDTQRKQDRRVSWSFNESTFRIAFANWRRAHRNIVPSCF